MMQQTVPNLIRKHITCLPVRMYPIARSLELAVKSAKLPLGTAGRIIHEPDDTYIIRVNCTLNKATQRYIVAHECAHFILHRDLIDQSPYSWIQDDVFFRNPAIPAHIETEAHQLAMEILMPRFLLEKELNTMTKIDHQEMASLAALCSVTQTRMELRLRVLLKERENVHAC